MSFKMGDVVRVLDGNLKDEQGRVDVVSDKGPAPIGVRFRDHHTEFMPQELELVAHPPAKPYMLFVYDACHRGGGDGAEGGFKDHHNDYATLEEARAAGESSAQSPDRYWHVVDVVIRRIVASSDQ